MEIRKHLRPGCVRSEAKLSLTKILGLPLQHVVKASAMPLLAGRLDTCPGRPVAAPPKGGPAARPPACKQNLEGYELCTAQGAQRWEA